MAQLSLLGDEALPAPTDRLFFAVMPDAPTAGCIASLGKSLWHELHLKGRPIEPERLHVTLHHVGDHPGLPPGVLDQALRAGAAVVAAPFDVCFDRAESFAGRPRNRPFVLRGGAMPDLGALQQQLGVAMAKAGLGRWLDKRFTPHVTLGYDDALVAPRPVAPVQWRVDTLVLVHSLLGQHCHVVVGRWPLRG